MRNYKFRVKDIKKIDKELCKFMKVCKKCGKLKLIIVFPKAKSCADGRINKCKKCNKNRFKHTCLQCGIEFSCFNKEQKYCSKKCSDEGKKREIKFVCDYCGSISNLNKNHYNRSKHHFCSNECKGLWYKENKKGKNNPNWNPNLTEEERRYNREHRRNIEGYVDFIKEVLKRDNYTCRLSGVKGTGSNLKIHHLNGFHWYIEGRIDPNNAVTLSKEVHDLFHKIYGKRNNTKEQFKEFEERYNNGEFKEVLDK